MHIPLAQKLRPRKFEEIAGHEQLIGSEGLLIKIIQSNKPTSILFWGPPGCGKTTMAKLYAEAFDPHFISLSAVFSGVAEIKQIIKEISSHPLTARQPVIFMDEIHRFNKAQQDAFLPLVEQGTIILVGATTENPSFSINSALVSRMRTFSLKGLDSNSLEKILSRYEKLIGLISFEEGAREILIEACSGDARYLLNVLEHLHSFATETKITKELLCRTFSKRQPIYDKKGEMHYNLISALHKSVRGSDPDASLYWFSRMLAGGEDPHFIARRLIRMASEDIGLSDPYALQMTLSAWEAYERLGSPEGELALAQAVVYLALCPKSNSIYTAYKKSEAAAGSSLEKTPPLSIVNAPTKLMKEMGYGKGYKYDHGEANGFSGANYFPDGMERESYYIPTKRGFEKELSARIDYFNKLRENNTNTKSQEIPS